MPTDLLLSGLGDQRRDARGSVLLARMVEHESAHLRVLARTRAEEVGFTRWLDCRHFDAATLRAGLRAHTARRCWGRHHVLVVQDTTEINYRRHARRTRGLGPIGDPHGCGLFVHALLALDAEQGQCLGLLDAQPWVRTPRQGDHRRLPLEAKESLRWVQGLASAAEVAAACRLVTVVADREGDLYELFARRPHERCHVLVRACRDRTLDDGRRLFATLDALPACLGYSLAVPARPGRPGRHARLLVRYAAVCVPRPRRCRDAVASVALWAVTVSEEDAGVPAGQRIVWRLLTSHEVGSAAQALRVIEWYRQRWHIEQVFRVLKGQGLDLPASQCVHAEGLSKLAVLSTHAAARIHQLVLARDGGTPVPAGTVFEAGEVATLAALLPQYEGKTAKQQNPHPPETLAWCAWIIARLGGWKGYRHSEGPPGPLTMRRGYERFAAIHQGYKLAQRNLCKP